MGFHAELEKVVHVAKSDIQAIGDFASEAAQMLHGKQTVKPNERFTQRDTNALRFIANALSEAAEAAQTGKGHSVAIKASKRVENFLLQVVMPIKHRSFLAEMTLAYLLAHQEAFIKDYVLQVLLHKRRLLISNVTVTYEEIASHNSIRSMWAHLAQKEVEALGYGSIDDVAQYFSKKLGIELASFEHWDTLREHSYRRNLIIHNRGVINAIYRKKTGCKEKSGHVTTDMEYVTTAVGNLMAFIEFVHSKVCEKFKLRDLTSKVRSCEATI